MRYQTASSLNQATCSPEKAGEGETTQKIQTMAEEAKAKQEDGPVG